MNVREGLARAIRKGFLGGVDGYSPGADDYDMADAVLAVFEVRPHGTVADPEALAAAWDEGFSLATRNSPNRPHPMAKMNPYRSGEQGGTVTDASVEQLREARAETWDEAIAAVFAWWNAPADERPLAIVNPYGVGLGNDGTERGVRP